MLCPQRAMLAMLAVVVVVVVAAAAAVAALAVEEGEASPPRALPRRPLLFPDRTTRFLRRKAGAVRPCCQNQQY